MQSLKHLLRDGMLPESRNDASLFTHNLRNPTDEHQGFAIDIKMHENGVRLANLISRRHSKNLFGFSFLTTQAIVSKWINVSRKFPLTIVLNTSYSGDGYF
jgi:hypothetical protein